VFHKKPRERRYNATFIDHGFCFNAGEWKFVDAALRGVYARNAVYRSVGGWDTFEPWLSRMEALRIETLWEIAETIPPEWYGGEVSTLESLVERLAKRRSIVRDLITGFKESSRQPFPNWNKTRNEEEKEQFPEPSWADDISGQVM
jgi:hypothetical protein